MKFFWGSENRPTDPGKFHKDNKKDTPKENPKSNIPVEKKLENRMTRKENYLRSQISEDKESRRDLYRSHLSDVQNMAGSWKWISGPRPWQISIVALSLVPIDRMKVLAKIRNPNPFECLGQKASKSYVGCLLHLHWLSRRYSVHAQSGSKGWEWNGSNCHGVLARKLPCKISRFHKRSTKNGRHGTSFLPIELVLWDHRVPKRKHLRDVSLNLNEDKKQIRNR